LTLIKRLRGSLPLREIGIWCGELTRVKEAEAPLADALGYGSY
jgi:hypothetical protein